MPGLFKSASLATLLAASVACAPMALAANQAGNADNASNGAAPASVTGTRQSGKDFNQQDANFIRHAIPAGMSEVKEGKLALQQSPNLAVQEFGRWMVTDHTELDKFLKNAAQSAGIDVPTSLSQQQQSKYDSLQGLKGQAFDRQYIDHQVQAHEKAVSLFRQEANSGQNHRVQAVAKQAVWVLQHHLAEAKQLQQALPSLTAQK